MWANEGILAVISVAFAGAVWGRQDLVSARSQPRARSQVLTPEEEVRVIKRNIPRHGKGGEAELSKTARAQSHEP